MCSRSITILYWLPYLSLDSWQHAYQQGLLGISLRNMGELEGAYKAFHVAEVFYEQVVKEEEEAILDRACNLRSLSLVSTVVLLSLFGA